MAEVLFPRRQRCKSCSKKLGDAGAPVYRGLFCAPRCAGMAEPVTEPAKAPRECKTERNGVWIFKRRYRSEGEIPDVLRADPSSKWYVCGHCGHLHIGHSRINLANETHRVLPGRVELCDLLVKARGQATLREVAEVAGVRPIRIKELEDPTTYRVDLDALFAVLGAYRLKMSVVLPVLARSVPVPPAPSRATVEVPTSLGAAPRRTAPRRAS